MWDTGKPNVSRVVCLFAPAASLTVLVEAGWIYAGRLFFRGGFRLCTILVLCGDARGRVELVMIACSQLVMA